MNEKNLVTLNNRTKSEQREIAQKGGKASAEARKRRKSLKESLELMLENDETQNSVAAALIERARKGDVRAFEVIRDTIGEKPAERIETKQTVVDLSTFTTEEIRAMLDDDV